MRVRLWLSIGIGSFVVVGCSAPASSPATKVAPTTPVATTSPIPSASQADASFHAALVSAEASIAIQTAGLSPQQQYAVAVAWEQAPITGDPVQTARAVWATTFLARLKTAQPTVVAAAPTPSIASPTQDPREAAASRLQQVMSFMRGPTPTFTGVPRVGSYGSCTALAQALYPNPSRFNDRSTLFNECMANELPGQM
jgi:hypothetical protein